MSRKRARKKQASQTTTTTVDHPREQIRAWWRSAVLVAVLAILPFVNAIGNDFVLDDRDIVAQNPFIRDLGNVGQIFSTDYWGGAGVPATRADPGLYRPLTVTTFALDYRWSGLKPAGYHVMNVALHAATSVVIMRAALALTVSPVAAIIAGAVFAVHPIHTEAVTGIVGRAEILATLFFMLAFVVGISRRASAESISPPTALRSAAVAGLYLLAVSPKRAPPRFRSFSPSTTGSIAARSSLIADAQFQR
jgi:hypothetical protein